MGRGVKLPKTHGDIFGGAPTPIMPTENIGIMSGAIRKKRGDKKEERGSRRAGIFGGSSVAQVTMRDPKTGRMYGGMVKDGVPQFEKPDFVSDEDFNKSFPKRIDASGIAVDPVTGKIVAPSEVIGRRKPRFDPRRPSAVQETRRVNVQDPTLGGPPEREVPIPRERRPRITRESDPRGEAPFAPDDSAAKDRFFETMFERAANQKERRAIDKAERRDTQESMREEAMLREREMSDRGRTRRRTRRKDFTRRRPEKRRSREERAAFRDRYVSTLGSNFFS